MSKAEKLPNVKSSTDCVHAINFAEENLDGPESIFESWSTRVGMPNETGEWATFFSAILELGEIMQSERKLKMPRYRR